MGRARLSPRPSTPSGSANTRSCTSDVQFNYQPLGSGAGIKQITEGTVDFGASDGPMNDMQIAEFKDKEKTDILHFPTVAGAVVPVYNSGGAYNHSAEFYRRRFWRTSSWERSPSGMTRP